jgi:ribosomal protein S18 acetylase RimI-like enzyme
MQPKPGLVRRATPDDAASLAEFAGRAFEETFGAANNPADTAAHIARSYGEALQRAEILDAGTVTLVFVEAASIAGFAQVRRHPPPPDVLGPDPVELRRFYVDRAHHGRGVAQRLMAEVHAAARELGGATLWLSTWTENPRAVAFYRKCGFDVVGSATFVVGSDSQTDHIMAAPVHAAPS